MGFLRDQIGGSFFKSLKLLALILGLGLLFPTHAPLGLGNPCLAGQPVERYIFWLKDPAAFIGRMMINQSAQFQLILRDDLWRLELIDSPQDVSRMAMEEYQSLAHRTGHSNVMPIADWIINFDPFIFKNKQIAQIAIPKNAELNEFVKAWDSFRARFISELQAFQQELRRRGYTKTAEIFLSKDVVQNGVRAALSDSDFHARIRSALSDALTRQLVGYPLEIDEAIEVPVFKKSGQARLKAALMVNPELALDELGVAFEPLEKTIDTPYRLGLGRLRIQLPLVHMSARVLDLEISADELKTPVSVSATDDVEIRVSFDRDHPIELNAEVVWDKILQRPELRVDRKSLKTPLASARLESISYRGSRFTHAHQSVSGWLVQNALLQLAEGSINDGNLLENLVINSLDPVQGILQNGIEINLDLVAIEAAQSDSESPVQVEVFESGNPRHDPVTNKNMIARFNFSLPLKVIDPHGDITVSSAQNLLSGRFKVGLLDPSIEIENIALFWRGERLLGRQLGLRAQLKNKLESATEIRGGGRLQVRDELQFELDPVEADLKGLSIAGVDVRLGNRWLKGRQPSLNMILENIESIRSALVTSRSQNKVGMKVQEWVESEIASEMNKRLTNLKVPFDLIRTHRIQKFGFDKTGYIRTSGEFRVDAVPIQDISIRLRDLQKSSPRCRGVYLVSAEAHLGLTEAVNLRSSPLSIEVGLDRYKSTIQALSVMALTVPSEGTYLDFVFDVCMSATQDNLDIQVRHLRQNLSKVQVSGVQVLGLSTQNEVLPQAPDYGIPSEEDGGAQMTSDFQMPDVKSLIETGLALYGTADGAEKDVRISKFIERIVKQNHLMLGEQIKSGMTDFFKFKVPYYLNSAPVKSQLESFIIDLKGVDEKVGELMFNLGELIQKPLSDLLSSLAGSYVKEALPKINQTAKMQRSVLDRLIVGFGEVAVVDLEMTAYSLLTRLVYGDRSFDRLKVDLERLMKPSEAVANIKESLGLSKYEDSVARLAWIRPYHEILMLLARCPYPSSEGPWREVEGIVDSLKVSSMQRSAIMSLIDEVCWDERPGAKLERINILNEWFGRGIHSVNEALMDSAIASYLKIPASEQVPLVTGPRSWTDDSKVDQDFQVPIEISRVSLIDDVFRISLYSNQFSNEWDGLSGRVAPAVKTALETDQNAVLLRVPRTIMNQTLLKIDWENLIRSNFKLDMNDVQKRSVAICDPQDEIVIRQAPMIGEDDMIHFNIYMKCRKGKVRLIVTPIIAALAKLFNPKLQEEDLQRIKEKASPLTQLPDVNAADVGGVLLSFFDLTNPLGFAVQTKGAVKVEFQVVKTEDGRRRLKASAEPLKIDEFKASAFLDQVILRRLEAVHHVANAIFDEVLGGIESLPQLGLFSNQAELEKIFLDSGDLYVQATHHAVSLP